jgi:uncharacterized protein (TIGR00369 family)
VRQCPLSDQYKKSSSFTKTLIFLTMATGAASKVLFDRVFQSFSRQGMMTGIGAKLSKVDKGMCEIVLPYSDKVTQQQGGFHGGATGAIADIAGGYASLTVAPEGMEVTTVEYKINFVGAFSGGHLRAIGKVVKPGRRVIVTTAEVYHVDEETGKESLCAIMQQSLVPVPKTY